MAYIICANNTTLKNLVTSMMKVILLREFEFEYDE